MHILEPYILCTVGGEETLGAVDEGSELVLAIESLQELFHFSLLEIHRKQSRSSWSIGLPCKTSFLNVLCFTRKLDRRTVETSFKHVLCKANNLHSPSNSGADVGVAIFIQLC